MTPEHPSDPPIRFGRLPRGRFAYTDEGDGPVVLALHGLPGSCRDWRWLGAALDGRLRLVRLEQPGFGQTPRATAPDPTLAGRAAFVRQAADALGLERFAVLGHSMGGPAAMAVAAEDERVTRLALLASVGLHPHRAARRFSRRPDLAWMLDLPLLPRLIAPRMRADFRKLGFPAWTPDSELLACTRVFSVLSFAQIRAVAARIGCPTMLAWAEDDPIVESAVALSLASELPCGPRVSYADGGHNIQKSRAVEVAEALLAWWR